jgi:steroid 5-alpha reductase family enzyme
MNNINIKDFLWVGFAYLAALLVANIYLNMTSQESLFSALLVADVLATAVVFGFSVLLRNASLYDPYWSVLPPVLALYCSAGGARAAVVIALVSLWGARLTYNWMRRWQGLSHEDWRYQRIRELSGAWYPLANFFGIHLFPTLMVFVGCFSVIFAVQRPEVSLGWLDALGVLVTGFAIWIEARADKELSDFLRAGPAPDEFLRIGVWAWCRHPNYLGEVSFWWGLYLFGAAAAAPWWIICGPLAMTFLFVGVSIPMMDKRMCRRREGYREYMQASNAIWPRLS